MVARSASGPKQTLGPPIRRIGSTTRKPGSLFAQPHVQRGEFEFVPVLIRRVTKLSKSLCFVQRQGEFVVMKEMLHLT